MRVEGNKTEKEENPLEWILTILGWFNPINLIGIITNLFTQPKLEIYYDKNETYHKVKDLSFNRITGNFAHVMVKNKGRRTAANCIAELRSIEIQNNGTYQHIPEYRKIMRLKWAHEIDFMPKDIETDIPRRLDVCYVHQGYDIIHFFTEKYATGNQTDFQPGKYRISIKVKCDNAKSVDKVFIITYQRGNFDSLEIRAS
jgi:hypothetical protein